MLFRKLQLNQDSNFEPPTKWYIDVYVAMFFWLQTGLALRPGGGGSFSMFTPHHCHVDSLGVTVRGS